MKNLFFLFFILISLKPEAQVCYRTSNHQNELFQTGLSGKYLNVLKKCHLNSDDKYDLLGYSQSYGYAYSYINNGNNDFIQGDSLYNNYGNGTTKMEVGNADGDTLADVFLGNEDGITISTNNGSGTFTIIDTIFIYGMKDFTVGDLNYDGIDDIALSNDYYLYTYEGDGTGNYIIADSAAGSSYLALKIADMDDNGSKEIISTAAISDLIFEWQIDPNGNIVQDSLTSTGFPGGIYYMESINFNNDSLLDIVGLNIGGSLFLMIQTAPAIYTVTQQVYPGYFNIYNENKDIIIQGDYNNDGWIDIVTSGYEEKYLWYNNNGLFDTANQQVFYTFDALVEDFDFNYDELPDLLCIGQVLVSQIDFRLNQSPGFFIGDAMMTNASSFLNLGNPRLMKIAKIDGDTLNDIVQFTPYGIEIFNNGGNENFEPYAKFTLNSSSSVPNPYNFEVDDFNGNGIPDALLPPAWDNLIRIVYDMEFYTYANIQTFNVTNAKQIAKGDFNNDGFMDFALFKYAPTAGFVPNIYLYINDGIGNFTPNYPFPVGFANGLNCNNKFLSADLEGDGDVDFVYKNTGNSLTYVYCTGGLTYATPVTIPSTGCNDFILGNFNNDTLVDICINTTTSLITFLGNGADFSLGSTMPAGTITGRMTTADMNLDGNDDIIAVDALVESIQIWQGDGVGNFANNFDITTNFSSGGIAVGNLNNDNYPDVIGVEPNLYTHILYSDSANHKLITDNGICNASQVQVNAPLLSSFDFYLNGNSQAIPNPAIFDIASNDTIYYEINYPGGCLIQSDTISYNFAICDSVWPGDVDMNGDCSLLDFIKLASYNGNSGIARTAQDIDWLAHYSVDWGIADFENMDLKFYDCDGNSLIELTDTTAIVQNLGQIHDMTRANSMLRSSNDFIYFVSDFPIYSPGQLVTMDVFLNDNTLSAVDLGGLALEMYFECNSLLPGSLKFNFENSGWMGDTGTELIKLTKVDESNQTLIGALAHFDQQLSSGYGKIGTIQFNTISSLMVMDTFRIHSDFAYTTDSMNQISTISVLSHEVIIDPTLSVEEEQNGIIHVYPNPTNGELYFLSENNVSSIFIFNLTGQEVFNKSEINSSQFNLMLDLPNGIYTISLVDSDGISRVKKLVIRN